MNSIFQSIFSSHTRTLTKKLFTNLKNHAETCAAQLPAQCLHCQMYKVTSALCTDMYSSLEILCPELTPREPSYVNVFNGVQYELLQIPNVPPIVTPNVLHLRYLLHQNSHEFSSNRQQCAYEYFIHLLNQLESEFTADVESDYSCWQTTRIVCTRCNGVYYQHSQVVNIDISVLKSSGDHQVDTSPSHAIPFAETIVRYAEEKPLENFDCRNCSART
uniref:Ubiquitin carboxyl-terminal hydrolase 14 n=1 Tax=Lygus hesperus TaxID=30085 RepID=A0A0A9VZV3_LYGHE